MKNIFAKFNYIFFIALLMVSFCFVNIARATNQWVANPASCSATHTDFPGQSCTPNNICGNNSNIAQCYNTASLPKRSTTSTADVSAGLGGGYVVDCNATADSAAPYCDHDGAYWCDANSTYTANHTQTICVGNKWASETGAYYRGDCISGYQDCNSSPDVCEIQTGAVKATNTVWAASCSSACAANYLDCDGGGAGGVDSDGCEIHVSGTCTAGGLTGAYGATCDGLSGNCVVPTQHFITGVNAEFSTTSPLLWGTQYGAGNLLQLTKNGVSTSTFVITNTGAVGIGTSTPNSSAALEINSSNGGLLLPRLTTSSISNAVAGLIIYDTNQNKLMYFNGSGWSDVGGGTSNNIYNGANTFNSSTIFNSISTFNSSTIFSNIATFNSSTIFNGISTFNSTTTMATTSISILGINTDSPWEMLTVYGGNAVIYNGMLFIGDGNSTTTISGNSTSSFPYGIAAAYTGGAVVVGTTSNAGDLKMRVVGKSGATYFCDANGENCKDPTASWGEVSNWRTTTVMHTGYMTTSLYTGYQAANTLCANEFSGYHFCATFEIMTYIKNNITNLGSFGTSNLNTWISNGPPGYLANANDCNGWTTSTDGGLGAIWIFSSSGGGKGYLTSCDQSKPLSCCK